MEPNSSIQDDDLFDQIMSVGDFKKNSVEALRNSMKARGAEDGFEGHVWPLIRHTVQGFNLKQDVKQRYGMQGVLEKESPNFFGGWTKRYVVLKAQRLMYKENSSPTSPTAGILNFHLLSCQIAVELKRNVIDNFRIMVENGEKEFVFRGGNLAETEEWYKAVSVAIGQSDGFGKKLTYLARYPRFWRKDYEAESEFRRLVEPGDILLFRGTKDTSVMQRAVTRDEFDHVGVVVLNQMGEPLIFQANGGFGVGICPWLKFMDKGWWKQYEIVVHRKLRVTRTQKFLQMIQTFVGSNMGKQYDFSLTNYIFQRSSSKDTQHKHYFCSSLVAKLYKRLGLLPQKKSCKQYLPSSFTEKNNLYLEGTGPFGYGFLDKEKIIVFEGGKGMLEK